MKQIVPGLTVIEPTTSWSPVGHTSDWANEAGSRDIVDSNEAIPMSIHNPCFHGEKENIYLI